MFTLALPTPAGPPTAFPVHVTATHTDLIRQMVSCVSEKPLWHSILALVTLVTLQDIVVQLESITFIIVKINWIFFLKIHIYISILYFIYHILLYPATVFVNIFFFTWLNFWAISEHYNVQITCKNGKLLLFFFNYQVGLVYFWQVDDIIWSINSSLWSTEFIVIHNGIITNYKDLRKFLVSQHVCPY